MAGANLSTRPMGGNRWVTVVSLDTTDETVEPVATGTDIYVHSITMAIHTAGATTGSVPITVERVTPSEDIIAAGTVWAQGGAARFTPKAQSDGLLVRAGTITNTSEARVTIYWSYKGGTAPTPV